MTADHQSEVLAASLAHSETQLLAQIADETGLDGRLMGVLGFNAALLATDIAAQALLRTWWWTPLPFVAVATISCLRSIFGKDTYLGPEALEFYATYGGQTSQAAREQLLADLDVAFKSNSLRAAGKAKVLKQAIGILSIGLVIAGLLIVFDTPSKVGNDVECSTVSSTSTCADPTEASSGAGAIGATAGRPARHNQIAP